MVERRLGRPPGGGTPRRKPPANGSVLIPIAQMTSRGVPIATTSPASYWGKLSAAERSAEMKRRYKVAEQKKGGKRANHPRDPELIPVPPPVEKV